MHLSGEMVDTVADYLTIFILFLANRVALHLALGGGFALAPPTPPPPTP